MGALREVMFHCCLIMEEHREPTGPNPMAAWAYPNFSSWRMHNKNVASLAKMLLQNELPKPNVLAGAIPTVRTSSCRRRLLPQPAALSSAFFRNSGK